MKKIQIVVVAMLLAPIAAFALTSRDQPEPAGADAARQTEVQQPEARDVQSRNIEDRDAQFESDVEAQAAPNYCIRVLGVWICA